MCSSLPLLRCTSKGRATMAVPIILAVPKGRILEEALPLIARAGIEPEAAFGDENSRVPGSRPIAPTSA